MTKMEKELEEGGVNNTNATVAKIENAIKELSAT